MRNWKTSGVLPLLLAVGCTAQLGTGEEQHGHGQHEMRVTANDISRWDHDGDWLVSPDLDAPLGASRVGVLLGLDAEGEMPAMEAQATLDGQPVGDWIPVDSSWSEVDMHVGIAEIGQADGARLRIAANAMTSISHFRWTAVVPDQPDTVQEPESDIGSSREALRSELNGLGIVTREQWGARRTRCNSQNASKTRMAIHYTVGPSQDPERQVRGIQRYHMDSRGWCDVGYHFLIGVDGSIYEGRPVHLRGAHVGGNNTGNIGISFIGCFNNSGCQSNWGSTQPTDAMIQRGGRLIRALSDVYGISRNRSRILGHREHSGQSTSCPGSYLLPRIEDMISVADGGSTPTPTPTDPTPPAPTDPTPDPRPAPTDPGGASCTHSYGGTYADTACSAGWQCCDGRWNNRGACGGCLCVEESGRTGCSSASTPTPDPTPAPPTPPPGASCGHTYGGTYANTACSPAWQCCDGRWRGRGACGACFCEESSGRSGCGT